MPYVPICYICNELKPDGPKVACLSDYCEGLHAERKERQEQHPNEIFMTFAAMPGGTTTAAGHMDHARKFNTDMHAYREAVRAGESPDQVSVEAVREGRIRQEAEETVGAVFG